jgi:hypothetical protein
MVAKVNDKVTCRTPTKVSDTPELKNRFGDLHYTPTFVHTTGTNRVHHLVDRNPQGKRQTPILDSDMNYPDSRSCISSGGFRTAQTSSGCSATTECDRPFDIDRSLLDDVTRRYVTRRAGEVQETEPGLCIVTCGSESEVSSRLQVGNLALLSDSRW